MTELRKQINNIVEDYNACKVLAKSVGNPSVYEGTTATSQDIRIGKTAYSNGELITGELEASDEVFQVKLRIPNVTNFQTFFSGLQSSLTGPIEGVIDCSNVTQLGYFIANCNNQLGSLENLKFKNTQNVKRMNYMFYNLPYLTALPSIDCSGCEMIIGVISGSTVRLEKIGSFINLGKGYTQKESNYNAYTLTLSGCYLVDREDFVKIINDLYDLNITYDVANGGTLYTQKLELGSSNLALLTAEEIAIATEKGWTVS